MAIRSTIPAGIRRKLGAGNTGWSIWTVATAALRCGSDEAEFVGWQALVDGAGVEIANRRGAKVQRFTGMLAEKLAAALDVIANHPELEPGQGIEPRCEIRVLRLHDLYLETVWLHYFHPGSADVVVPYNSFDPELKEKALYPLEYFLDIAAQIVDRRVVPPTQDDNLTQA
jgi:hypothetical protein